MGCSNERMSWHRLYIPSSTTRHATSDATRSHTPRQNIRWQFFGILPKCSASDLGPHCPRGVHDLRVQRQCDLGQDRPTDQRQNQEADKNEKHPFIDKQSQIAEQKTVGEQGPGDRSKKAA